MNNVTAHEQGFTKQVVADAPEYTLNLLICPGTDYDDRFRAWDMDEQEWLWVNGWMFDINDVE
jgi:hypothetical protein